jgi:hypothetical protein
VKIQFLSFNLGDVEDPQLYAEDPIWKWQQTEHGKWVGKHADDLTWQCYPDVNSFGFKVQVTGEIKDAKKITEYFLRWPEKR